MASTAKWFLQVLPQATGRTVSPHLHQKCAMLVKDLWKCAENDAEYDFAKLELGHPTRPRSDHMLNYFRMSEDHAGRRASVEKFLDSGSEVVLTSLRMFILRLAQACEAGDRSADARWVLDYGLRHMPDYFMFRKPVLKPTNKVPPYLKRKATARELGLGIDVDGEGYVIRTPQRKRLFEASFAAVGR